MTRTRANLLLLGTGAIWGMGFIAQSSAMKSVGPYLFVGLRSALAALVLLPLAMRETSRCERALPRTELVGFLGIGIVLFLGMITQQIGLKDTTVTNSGFLTGMYVVLTPILSVLFLRLRPHPVVWPAASLALLGIYLLSGGSLSGLSRGDMMTLLSAVFWALQMILIGKFVQVSGRPFTLCAVQFAICAFLGMAGGFLLETVPWQAIQAAAWEILFAGIVSSALAFTLQVIGQRYTTASQAAIFLSSESLFAALFGAVMLGEQLGMIGYLGCALMFVSILLVELVPSWKRQP